MIFEKKFIKEHLGKTLCHKCGSSLEGARIEPISEAPIALIAYAACPKCRAESMITFTPSGSGSVPLMTDLNGAEFKKFIKSKTVSYDDLLNLHKMLEKKSVWNLLLKYEKNLEKKLKT